MVGVWLPSPSWNFPTKPKDKDQFIIPFLPQKHLEPFTGGLFPDSDIKPKGHQSNLVKGKLICQNVLDGSEEVSQAANC